MGLRECNRDMFCVAKRDIHLTVSDIHLMVSDIRLTASDMLAMQALRKK